ncbi:hypothetical protein BIV23_35655 [Streptomyces monashensis]|uniref:Peptidase S1 domain-containing protein n=1 Tax=Streptomyces monashensis TaxID=1678012 RepID=A0A1S2PMH5_9ACTN|nr:hypothetical protein BIV23_35655 [Streptomyces monashensis]
MSTSQIDVLQRRCEDVDLPCPLAELPDLTTLSTVLDRLPDHYQEGTVSGLIQTDVCAEPGDSGGALFDGESALGLTSGGSGDCTNGGQTFFQPVPAALAAYGAQIG